METDNKKVKRYSFWAVFIISIGMIASYILPEESIPHFFELLKDVISLLIIS